MSKVDKAPKNLGPSKEVRRTALEAIREVQETRILRREGEEVEKATAQKEVARDYYKLLGNKKPKHKEVAVLSEGDQIVVGSPTRGAIAQFPSSGGGGSGSDEDDCQGFESSEETESSRQLTVEAARDKIIFYPSEQFLLFGPLKLKTSAGSNNRILSETAKTRFFVKSDRTWILACSISSLFLQQNEESLLRQTEQKKETKGWGTTQRSSASAIQSTTVTITTAVVSMLRVLVGARGGRLPSHAVSGASLTSIRNLVYLLPRSGIDNSDTVQVDEEDLEEAGEAEPRSVSEWLSELPPIDTPTGLQP